MSTRKSAGQSLVEFAVVVPVLLIVLLMAVDFGRVYLGWVNLTNVARIGANFAAANPDAWNGTGDAAVQLRYRQLMARDATGIDCTLPSVFPQPSFVDASYSVGARVQVNLTCSFSLLTPLISSIVGDGAGNVAVGANALFTIRYGSPDAAIVIGGGVPAPTPTSAPTPSAPPAATPTPAPTSSSGPTPTPGASSTPSAPPTVVVSFYGSPTSADGSGGGPPGSTDENLIVGIPTLNITFYNTTTGANGQCEWDFGDGTKVSKACSGSVTHSYTARGLFSVTLEVDGWGAGRSNYVLVGCKVPSFSGVRRNEATAMWTGAGFASSNITLIDVQGNGNYKIGYQSLVGGLVNPPGGCSGATVTVGP